jgi:peroxiredoxin Q/BCP
VAKKTAPAKKASVKTAAAPKAAAKKTAVKKAAAGKKPVAGETESFLKVGAKAPAFKVPDESGKLVSLASLKGKKVVLYFYPKDMTPGCTQESCDFRDNFARLKKMGVEVFGVSKDSQNSHVKFIGKNNLPFSLLADEDGKMCEAYGVWKEKSLYGRKYMGIERTTVVIDEQGKVSHVYPKVSVKGHVDQVMEDLK